LALPSASEVYAWPSRTLHERNEDTSDIDG